MTCPCSDVQYNSAAARGPAAAVEKRAEKRLHCGPVCGATSHRDGDGAPGSAALALALVALGSSPGLAQDRRESEAALSAVRKEIKELQERIARETTRRDESTRALRAAELKIAAATRKLADVRKQAATQQSARRELTQETQRANGGSRRRKMRSRARCARATWPAARSSSSCCCRRRAPPHSGGCSSISITTTAPAPRASARSPASSRSSRSSRAETTRVEAELAALEAAQAREVASLEKSRDERRAAVAKVDEEIRDGTAAVAKLRGEEQRLAELVLRLSEVMAGFPVDTDEPFASAKGKLAWPVQGRIAGNFGQSRGAGPVKWNGVLLEAAAGTPVRAVYHGRVAFADWLPGLGLLVIVDHGGGYMSLYGHNEALLKESGDWVEPGEPIAQVGDTGGQARAGLYFEIRLNGEPVDPNPWIAKRSAAR